MANGLIENLSAPGLIAKGYFKFLFFLFIFPKFFDLPLAARSVLHYPLLAQQISEERSGVYW